MKISIITPTYNSVETLEQSVLSVLNQNDPDLEYLFIDGGSTDGTVDLIKIYAEHRPFIKWLSEPDEGIADAFNKGLALAKGDVVGILNSDDSHLPETLRLVRELFQANPEVDVVHGDLIKQENGKEVCRLKPAGLNTLWCGMPLNHPATFVRRRAYDLVGGFDCRYRLAMDYDLIVRLYTAGCRFQYLAEPLAIMNYGGASDDHFVAGAREVCQISVRHGYPRWKAQGWFFWSCIKGAVKRLMRSCNLHHLMRLHPRFRG